MKEIKTNIIAVSKAFAALGAVNYVTIPIPEIESVKNYEVIASALLVALGTQPEASNMFFSAILGEDRDYSSMESREAVELTVNFYKSIGDVYRESILKLLIEGREQRLTVMKNQQKMIARMLEKAIAKAPNLGRSMLSEM